MLYLLPTDVAFNAKPRTGKRVGRGIPAPANAALLYGRQSAKELQWYFKQVSEVILSGAENDKRKGEIKRDIKEYYSAYKDTVLTVIEAKADMLVDKITKYTDLHFGATAKQQLGRNVVAVLSDKEKEKIRRKFRRDNVKYFRKAMTDFNTLAYEAVRQFYDGEEFTGGGDSLEDRLKNIQKSGIKHGKLIAQDQTIKLTASLSRAQQQEAGCKQYVWRTRKDKRVVGNPKGIYPHGTEKHGDHWHREGKRFSWDTPPHDGHPGEAFGCRCFAAPVFIAEKTKVKKITKAT